jgi:hypothetical protein
MKITPLGHEPIQKAKIPSFTKVFLPIHAHLQFLRPPGLEPKFCERTCKIRRLGRSHCFAARLGLEPRYIPPEGIVLPLDDLAIRSLHYTQRAHNTLKCVVFQVRVRYTIHTLPSQRPGRVRVYRWAGRLWSTLYKSNLTKYMADNDEYTGMETNPDADNSDTNEEDTDKGADSSAGKTDDDN